jgi:hypothetical protein
MFRRLSVRYGRTPEPVTPYQKAAQAWDERIGSARVQARNWRLIAFGNLFLAAGHRQGSTGARAPKARLPFDGQSHHADVPCCALPRARQARGLFKPNLKFGITLEQVTKREVSEAEETALINALREDYHDIFAFALLSGIRETGVCTLERSKVDLANAQVTFRSKRHRGDPPGFVRWETQALGPLEVALLTEIMAAKYDPKFVFTYVARGKKGGKGGTGIEGEFEAGKRYPITLEGSRQGGRGTASMRPRCCRRAPRFAGMTSVTPSRRDYCAGAAIRPGCRRRWAMRASRRPCNTTPM